MAWPKGKCMARESLIKRNKTRWNNLLIKAKKKYSGNQEIGKFGSIIHWDSLCIRKFKTRTRRGVNYLRKMQKISMASI